MRTADALLLSVAAVYGAVEVKLSGEVFDVAAPPEGCFDRASVAAAVDELRRSRPNFADAAAATECASGDGACLVRAVGRAIVTRGGASCRGGVTEEGLAPYSDLNDYSVECLFPGSVWLRGDQHVHHCPRIHITPAAGATYCYSVAEETTGREILNTCYDASKVPDWAPLGELDLGRYRFVASLSGTDAPPVEIGFTVAAPPLRTTHERSGTVVLGLFLGHDAHLSLHVDGELVEALELERVYRVRHFMPRFENASAVRHILETNARAMLARHNLTQTGIDYVANAESHMCCRAEVIHTRDDTVAYDVFSGPASIWNATWTQTNHYDAHAMIALVEGAGEKPLIYVSDSNVRVYRGRSPYSLANTGEEPLIERVAAPSASFGLPYELVAVVLEEVTGGLENFDEKWAAQADRTGAPVIFSHAGKAMGYAGLGEVRDEWLGPMRDLYARSAEVLPVTFLLTSDAMAVRRYYGLRGPLGFRVHGAGGVSLRTLRESDVTDLFPDERGSNATSYKRDLAATVQRAFEDGALEILESLVREDAAIDSIAMSGGCALNVLANSRIEAELQLPVSVSPAPNDCGLAVGAAWHVRVPTARPPVRDMAYAGPLLFDDPVALVSSLEATGAIAVERGVSVERLADVLAAGAIVGVARGRMEFGPRALGHRSLLGDPSRLGSKDRLNRLKHREWWRPTAPVVAEDDARAVFGHVPRSPYMSFAPKLTPAATAALPGIHHFDGTARPQLVGAVDEPWLHALLLAVKKRTGWAVLINTSFNTKGRPILNTAAEALDLLRDSPDLDAVLLELEDGDAIVRCIP